MGYANVMVRASLLRTLFILSLVAAFFFVPFFGASAFVPCFGGVCFGGRITFTMPCECQGAIFMMVGNPSGGPFIVLPSTIRYRHGLFTTPQWTIGKAGPNLVACIKPVCKGKCCATAMGYPVTYAGTSAISNTSSGGGSFGGGGASGGF